MLPLFKILSECHFLQTDIFSGIFPHVCFNVSSLFILYQYTVAPEFCRFSRLGQIEVRWIGKIFPLGITFALTSTAKVYPRSELLLFTFLSTGHSISACLLLRSIDCFRTQNIYCNCVAHPPIFLIFLQRARV